MKKNNKAEYVRIGQKKFYPNSHFRHVRPDVLSARLLSDQNDFNIVKMLGKELAEHLDEIDDDTLFQMAVGTASAVEFNLHPFDGIFSTLGIERSVATEKMVPDAGADILITYLNSGFEGNKESVEWNRVASFVSIMLENLRPPGGTSYSQVNLSHVSKQRQDLANSNIITWSKRTIQKLNRLKELEPVKSISPEHVKNLENELQRVQPIVRKKMREVQQCKRENLTLREKIRKLTSQLARKEQSYHKFLLKTLTKQKELQVHWAKTPEEVLERVKDVIKFSKEAEDLKKIKELKKQLPKVDENRSIQLAEELTQLRKKLTDCETLKTQMEEEMQRNRALFAADKVEMEEKMAEREAELQKLKEKYERIVTSIGTLETKHKQKIIELQKGKIELKKIEREKLEQDTLIQTLQTENEMMMQKNVEIEDKLNQTRNIQYQLETEMGEATQRILALETEIKECQKYVEQVKTEKDNVENDLNDLRRELEQCNAQKRAEEQNSARLNEENEEEKQVINLLEQKNLTLELALSIQQENYSKLEREKGVVSDNNRVSQEQILNLDRELQGIQTVIQSIQQQLQDVENEMQQAKKGKTEQQLQQPLLIEEIKIKIGEIKQSIEARITELKQLKLQMTLLNKKQKELEEEKTTISTKVDDLTRANAELNEKIASLTNENKTLKSKLEAKRTEFEILKQQLEHSKNELSAAQTRETENDKEIQRLNGEHERKLEEMRSEIQNQLGTNTKDLKTRFESEKAALQEKHQKKDIELQNELRSIQSQMHALQNEKTQTEERNKELEARLKSVEEEMNATMDSLRTENNTLKSEIAECETNIAVKDKQLRKLNERKNELEVQFREENTLLKRELEHLKTEKDQIAQNLEAQNVRHLDSEITVSAARQIEMCYQNINDLAIEVEDLKEKINNLQTERDNLNKTISQLQEQITQQEARMAEQRVQYKTHIDVITREMDSLKETSASHDIRFKKIEEKLREKEEELKKLKEAHAEELRKKDALIRDLQNHLNLSKTRIQDLETALNETNTKISTLNEELLKQKAEDNTKNSELQALTTEKQELERKIEEFKIKLEQVENSNIEEKTNLRIAMQQIESEYERMNIEWTRSVAELKELKILTVGLNKTSETVAEIRDKILILKKTLGETEHEKKKLEAEFLSLKQQDAELKIILQNLKQQIESGTTIVGNTEVLKNLIEKFLDGNRFLVNGTDWNQLVQSELEGYIKILEDFVLHVEEITKYKIF